MKQLRITVSDYLSIKHVNLFLNPGVNILAGKNGAGKSQVLFAINSRRRFGHVGLEEYGYPKPEKNVCKMVPEPKLGLLRPATRRLAESSRRTKHAQLGRVSQYINLTESFGYSRHLDARFTNLQDLLGFAFISHGMTKSVDSISQWEQIRTSFFEVFNKSIDGVLIERAGVQIGVKLENGKLSDFSTLSTGELEFLSLLYDIISEPDVDLFLVDEIDLHFHPELQKRIIEQIEKHVQDRFVLATTQSPIVMISAKPENVFFIQHYSEIKDAANQVKPLTSDIELLTAVSEMYPGMAHDIRLSEFYRISSAHEILMYAEQCLSESAVISADKGKDADLQIATLRTLLLTLPDGSHIIEIGSGKGRMLAAFRKLDPKHCATLRYTGVDTTPKHFNEIKTLATEIGIQGSNVITCLTTDEYEEYDLAVLSNVIHEVGPDNLAAFLTKMLQSAKKEATAVLLEVRTHLKNASGV